MFGQTPDWLQEIREYWSQLVHEQQGGVEMSPPGQGSEAIPEVTTQAVPSIAVTQNESLKL